MTSSRTPKVPYFVARDAYDAEHRKAQTYANYKGISVFKEKPFNRLTSQEAESICRMFFALWEAGWEVGTVDGAREANKENEVADARELAIEFRDAAEVHASKLLTADEALKVMLRYLGIDPDIPDDENYA